MNKLKIKQLICFSTLFCSAVSLMPVSAYEVENVGLSAEIISTSLSKNGDIFETENVALYNFIAELLDKGDGEEILMSELDSVSSIIGEYEFFKDIELSDLTIFSNLTSLSLYSVGDADLTGLASLNLDRLTISGVASDISVLSTLDLSELSISSTKKENFALISQFQNLEKLSISNDVRENNKEVPLVDNMEFIKSLPKLKSLTVTAKMTGEYLDNIAEVTGLTELNIYDGNEGYLNIDKLSSLVNLENFFVNSMERSSIETLNNFTNLKSLSVLSSNVTSSDLDRISETLKKLDDITIKNAYLTDIDLFKDLSCNVNLGRNFIEMNEETLPFLKKNFSDYQLKLETTKENNEYAVGLNQTVVLDGLDVYSYDSKGVRSDWGIPDYSLVSYESDNPSIFELNTETMTVTGKKDGIANIKIFINDLRDSSTTSLDIRLVVGDVVTEGTYTIVCKDESGNVIDTIGPISSQPGDYTITPPKVSGYTSVDNSEKPYTVEAGKSTTIEFTYAKNATDDVEQLGKIIVKHIDVDTKKEIAVRDIYDDVPIGETTVYSKNEMEGYELVGDTIKTVEITAENLTQEVIFEYKKINSEPGDENTEDEVKVKGSIEVQCIDANTGKYLGGKLSGDLEIKSYDMTAPELTGYTLVDSTSKTVTLTKENPNVKISFLYVPTSGAAVLSRDEITEYVLQGEGITLTRPSGKVEFSSKFVEKIAKNLDGSLVLNMTDNVVNSSLLEKLKSEYKFNLLSEFNLTVNLAASKFTDTIEITKNVDTNKDKVYLYRFLSDSNIEYIGEADVHNGSINFETTLLESKESPMISSVDFFVSDTKLVKSSTGDSNVTVTDKDDKEDIPFAGGFSAFSAILGGMTLVGGSLFTLKKKK